VADLVRGLSVADALVQLTFSQKRISNDVKDTLLSAIANAENNHGLDIDRLYINEIRVGRAMVMKRFRPRARGRVGKILKPFSHLEVIVRETEEE
jgi:large subunit ribosomal protein L22